MAKATITVSSRVYAAGTRSVELPNLTSDDNGINISLTREAWTDTGGIVLTIQVEGSDNGVDRYDMAATSFVGGVMLNRQGQPQLTCGISVYWPEKNIGGVFVPQRPANVYATLTNAVSLRTAVTLTGT